MVVSHIEEKLKQKITCDQIAVFVTSPEFGHKDDLLLGVVQSNTGKALDQVLVIQNLLEHFEVPDHVYAFCTDTTATNTGRLEGTIMILTRILKKPLLWLMCQHHIYKLHITYVYKAITGVISKGPNNTLYSNFRK